MAGAVVLNVRSGLEIVKLHNNYEEKIKELENALAQLKSFNYVKSVLEADLARLRDELKMLETTRFQAMEPVNISTSSLGGHDYYVS